MADEQAESLALDYQALTYEDLTREVAAVIDDLYLEARAFYEGDHWQRGDAWVGPHPSEDEDGTIIWTELEAGLAAHPATEEIVNRHRDAVIGQEPFWSLVPRRPMALNEKPTPEEQTIIDEWEAQMTDWWEDHEALEIFQLATEDLCLGGRGIGRLFIPEGNLAVDQEGRTIVPSGDFETQLDLIWPTFIPADEGAVPRDPLTMRQFGIFLYDVTEVLGGVTRKFAEMTYLDDNRQTVTRTVEQTGNPPTGDEVPNEMTWDLGGRLTMFEMKSKPLVTEPIIAFQKLLNKTGTMLSRNVDLGGFLERLLFNGQLPGETEVVDGKTVFVPKSFEVGAGTFNQIQGIQIGTKEDGNPIISDPRVQYRDPVDVTCFKETLNICYRTVLTAARQLHVLIAADANASGEARKQARDDFTKSLKRTKTKLDRFGRWMLETATKMADYLADQPNKHDEYRVVFNTQLDPGPISADDRAAIVSEYQVHLRSQEGSMALLGIDDTAAEQTTIAAEQAAQEILTPGRQTAQDAATLRLKADQAALAGTTPSAPSIPPTPPPTPPPPGG